jgi:hypothetical protein
MGSVTGSGTVWNIEVTQVIIQGQIFVTVDKAGIDIGQRWTAVYKGP